MEPQRILFINGGIMHRGGIESYMMSYYRNIDREKLQIDFIVHGNAKGVYDDEIKSLGGKIFNVPVKSRNYFGNINQIKKILKTSDYKIIHSHMDAMGAVVLKIAKNCGIPIRIAHSHNTKHLTNNRFKHILNEYARNKITSYATHYFACSEPAGRWLFGDENSDIGKVEYIKNAINLEDFLFDEEMRRKIRIELNVEDKFVVGHVGRFDYQKNHIYLLELFSKFYREHPNSKLILVGNGHLRKKIISKIEALNLKDSVILLNTRDDVNKILSVFDVLVMPSHFEGLGIALVEAQANGLHCIASAEIPEEVNITGNVTFIPINNKDIDKWVQALSEKIDIKDRTTNLSKFIIAGYSITNEAIKLQEKYIKYLGELQ